VGGSKLGRLLVGSCGVPSLGGSEMGRLWKEIVMT
jgi:hypothetical protein